MPKGSLSNVVSTGNCSPVAAVPNLHNRDAGSNSSVTGLARLTKDTEQFRIILKVWHQHEALVRKKVLVLSMGFDKISF